MAASVRTCQKGYILDWKKQTLARLPVQARIDKPGTAILKKDALNPVDF
jgi:hypothetical protein